MMYDVLLINGAESKVSCNIKKFLQITKYHHLYVDIVTPVFQASVVVSNGFRIHRFDPHSPTTFQTH